MNPQKPVTFEDLRNVFDLIETQEAKLKALLGLRTHYLDQVVPPEIRESRASRGGFDRVNFDPKEGD